MPLLPRHVQGSVKKNPTGLKPVFSLHSVFCTASTTRRLSRYFMLILVCEKNVLNSLKDKEFPSHFAIETVYNPAI
ncbi:hypothetical protein J4E91_000718 [Alternaria rosae]|nr:hypothetical protein J4E91_000718 [Alternaria rosae]